MEAPNTMKLHGAWEVKRSIRLASPLLKADTERLHLALTRLPGVIGVRAEPTAKWVEVHYDITKTDFQTLQQAIEASGVVYSRHGWARLKSMWWLYLDRTGRDNAGVKPAACCNKPPPRL